MKSLVLIFCVSLVSALGEPDNRLHEITVGMARTFSISEREAEICIHKAGATVEDLSALDESVLEKADENKDSVRRGTCAMVCCAQVQGTMIGAQLQIATIHKLIESAKMPAEMKYKHLAAVDHCAELVKNGTDACEVGYDFVKCLVNLNWEDRY